jgi:hypothetical protein
LLTEVNNSGVYDLKLMGQLCSEVFSGSEQLSHASMMRHNEHAWRMQLYQLNKLAVAEHSIEKECQIDFKSTTSVARAMNCTNCLVKEAV